MAVAGVVGVGVAIEKDGRFVFGYRSHSLSDMLGCYYYHYRKAARNTSPLLFTSHPNCACTEHSMARPGPTHAKENHIRKSRIQPAVNRLLPKALNIG